MIFKIYWNDGSEDLGEGTGVADAFTKLGYGAGAMSALSHYDEVQFTMHDVPPQLLPHADPDECTVEASTDGDHVVVDHSIQQPIGSGTRAGCYEAIKRAKQHGAFESIGV